MTYQIGEFTVKTAADVRADFLRTIRNGLIAKGIDPNPQLGPGSDEDLYARAISNEAAPLYANLVIKGDALMPDTAAGTPPVGQNVGVDLARIMRIYGLAPRGVVPATGSITLDCSAATIIPGRDGGAIGSGTMLIDAAGLRFEVLASGTYNAGDLVAIEAVDGGAPTNHDAGDVLQWVVGPPYCAQKQVVAGGGLTGGADAEDNETARARLFNRLQNPPGSGNWPQVAVYAESSTPIVQKGFVYPAANGPSTVHVVVVGYATSVSKSRVVSSTIMTGTVVPYVAGQMPEYVETTTTTVVDSPTDIAIGLTLPSAPTASPAGPGGGWVDGTPWPALVANTKCQVTSVSPGGLTFVVDAETAPTPNVTHICTLDTVTWKLLRAKVVAVSGTAGAYTITIDKPFPNLTLPNIITGETGSLIFPDAVNMQTYVDALLAEMALFGPGEVTANATALSRAFRHPLPQVSWPYALNAQLLKAIESTGDEVLDTSYFYRERIVPDVPATVNDKPNILIPRHIGFYPL